MVIMHLSGGFGNQLFSYAFGYAMAKRRNQPLVIDTAIQDADWFFRNPDIMNMNIQYDRRLTYPIKRGVWDRAVLNRIRFRNAIGWSTKEVIERQVDKLTYCEKYMQSEYDDVYMRGDWQSEYYFREFRNDIIDMFTFREELSKEAGQIKEEMDRVPESVAVHCRRSDYVTLGIALDADYFYNAITEMARRIENPVFFCFSEDLEWAKKQFQKLPYDIRYPEYQSEQRGIEDFRLISAAKNQILSNSTYSWWAAYLNGNEEKTVICPVIDMWREAFWPERWIKLEVGK